MIFLLPPRRPSRRPSTGIGIKGANQGRGGPPVASGGYTSSAPAFWQGDLIWTWSVFTT